MPWARCVPSVSCMDQYSRPRAGARDLHIGTQRGGTINNVDGNQYLIAQKENFLREVAATRTKARYLVGLGFALFVVGLGMFATSVLTFLSKTSSALDDFWKTFNESWTTGQPPAEFPLAEATGFNMPLFIGGWSLAAIGSLMIFVGIVLHVVTTSRRRRTELEIAALAPRAAYRR